MSDESENSERPAEASEDNLQALSERWTSAPLSERKILFASLARTDAEEFFLGLKSHDQAELLQTAQGLERRSWVRMLAPDDVADVIQELGVDHREEILSHLDPQTKREVTALLAYAEDNAGGLMNSRFIRLRPEMSVDEAISYLRIQAKTQVETIYYAYVIDNDQTLLGVISFRELFAGAAHKKIRDIMTTDLIKVPVGLDQEHVAKIFSQSNLLALPVIDEWSHMKGIITFDDIAHVMQEEATEDIQKLGAVEALDLPYMKTGFWELLRKRAGWLIILFISEMFTATAMVHFQSAIEKTVALAMFIPLIISSGGTDFDIDYSRPRTWRSALERLDQSSLARDCQRTLPWFNFRNFGIFAHRLLAQSKYHLRRALHAHRHECWC
jgi:magnesium transporter